MVNWAEFLNHKTIHLHWKITRPIPLTEKRIGYLRQFQKRKQKAFLSVFQGRQIKYHSVGLNDCNAFHTVLVATSLRSQCFSLGLPLRPLSSVCRCVSSPCIFTCSSCLHAYGLISSSSSHCGLWPMWVCLHFNLISSLRALCCSITQSCPILQPHGLQHTRLPCPSSTCGVCSNSCPLS